MLFHLTRPLIFPGAYFRKGSPGARPPDGLQPTALATASGEQIYYLSYADAPNTPIEDDGESMYVLFFHGNGSIVENLAHEARQFRALGCQVILPEFVGYSHSSGRPSEAGCYETGDSVIRHLTEACSIRMNRIAAVGYSLGGATAIEMCLRYDLKALVTVSAFTSSVAMALRYCRIGSINRMAVRDHFDNLNKISRVKCPVLIIHGTDDTVVPYTMGQQLHHAARGSHMVTVKGACHEDIFSIDWQNTSDIIASFVKQ